MTDERTLSLFTCPICWRSVASYGPPPGWQVRTPFPRVVACIDCAPSISLKDAS